MTERARTERRIDCGLDHTPRTADGFEGAADEHCSLIVRVWRDRTGQAAAAAIVTNGGPCDLDVSESGSEQLVSAAAAAEALDCDPAAIRTAVIAAYPLADAWDWGPTWHTMTERERTIAQRGPAIVDGVVAYHSPPARHGQMVEVSYGYSADGDYLVRRTIDRSDRTTSYAIADLAWLDYPDIDPEGTEPAIEAEDWIEVWP